LSACEEELCCEFEKTRILLRILRSSVWRTSSEVRECTEIAKLLGVPWQLYSARRALREYADSRR
jgi:hypothetical protein